MMASYSLSWENTQITRHTAVEDAALFTDITDRHTPDHNSASLCQPVMPAAAECPDIPSGARKRTKSRKLLSY